MRRLITLYFDPSCPNVDEARGNIAEAIRSATAPCEVKEVDISILGTESKFRGSPTITVDGKDVEGSTTTPTGDCCRVYKTSSGRFRGAPAIENIIRALLG